MASRNRQIYPDKVQLERGVCDPWDDSLYKQRPYIQSTNLNHTAVRSFPRSSEGDTSFCPQSPTPRSSLNACMINSFSRASCRRNCLSNSRKQPGCASGPSVTGSGRAVSRRSERAALSSFLRNVSRLGEATARFAEENGRSGLFVAHGRPGWASWGNWA